MNKNRVKAIEWVLNSIKSDTFPAMTNASGGANTESIINGLPVGWWSPMRKAFYGSLDSASEFQKLVLPKWLSAHMPNVVSDGTGLLVSDGKMIVRVYNPNKGIGFTAVNETHSIAWLIATLEAKKLEETKRI